MDCVNVSANPPALVSGNDCKVGMANRYVVAPLPDPVEY